MQMYDIKYSTDMIVFNTFRYNKNIELILYVHEKKKTLNFCSILELLNIRVLLIKIQLKIYVLYREIRAKNI